MVSGQTDYSRESSNVASGTKECPFCAETIKAAARKCYFCTEFLEGHTRESILGDNIQVGDLSNVIGVAIGRRARASVTKQSGADVEEIANAFAEIYRNLDQKEDTPKKTMAAVAVRGLEEEANKGEHVDESKVEEWFTTLMAMLPDIGEVAINTFINPISGLSTVFQKIANKAKGTLEVR